MSIVRRRLTGLALPLLLASTLAAGVLAGLPVSATADAGTACENVSGGFEVVVTKGNVSCPTAQSVAQRFLKTRHCGSGKEAACVVEGFHCRLSSFGEQLKTGVGAYCYQLAQPKPAVHDFSGYHLGRFTKAITITLPEN